MAQTKSPGGGTLKPPKTTIYTAFQIPFYISAVIGVLPFSIMSFFREQKFKVSWLGNIWCLCTMVNLATNYHFATTASISGEESSKTSNLTQAIGLFILYMEPAMMIVDVLASIINQKTIISVFDRLKAVDDKLENENIDINYARVVKLSKILFAAVFLTELTLTSLNFVAFTETFEIRAIYFYFTGFPLILNASAKIWFVALIVVVRQRFQAINKYLNETSKKFAEQKKKYQTDVSSFVPDDASNFLEKDMLFVRNKTFKGNIIAPKTKTIKVSPFEPIKDPNPYLSTITGDTIKVNENVKFSVNDKEFLVGEKMDHKLTILCKLHDEICEIAKTVNQMFSFQMLMMMAYGFMSVTAQFYFLYCGLMDQPIPSQFRSAASIHISLLFIFYTACKCVVITFVCWKTKYDARKTGVYLHKLAHTVDELHFYNIVNHLSLKLLNHQLNFTACGFFDLDMTTIYAITGAITSYLIILIQFNLAAVRTKKPGDVMNVTTIMPLTNVTGPQ